MMLADLATYVVTSVQLGLAFPDAVSGFAGGIAGQLVRGILGSLFK